MADGQKNGLTGLTSSPRNLLQNDEKLKIYHQFEKVKKLYKFKLPEFMSTTL